MKNLTTYIFLALLVVIAVASLSGCKRTSYPAVWIEEPKDAPPYTVDAEKNAKSDSKVY